MQSQNRGRTIKVLIVDDSALMRRYLLNGLQTEYSIEVVGIARDGEEAYTKVQQLHPDVVTLDINMPVLDGITTLQLIKEYSATCAVIMVSLLTTKDALTTFEALELGAFDFIAKPNGNRMEEKEQFIEQLIEKVLTAGKSRRSRKKSTNQIKLKNDNVKVTSRSQSSEPQTIYTKIVVIGVSTGGPNTLAEILPYFPKDFPVPVIIVQHMPGHFTSSYARRLNETLPMHVVEADHRMPIHAGAIYIAPGGKHMHVEKTLGKKELRFSLSEHPKELYYKPSVDVTMLSLIKHFPAKQVVAVLLTGIGNDGAKGMVEIHKQKGFTIAESEETAVVYGMPRVAIENKGASIVLPSYKIGEAICKQILDK